MAGKRRKAHTVLTEKIKEEVVRDYHDDKMSYTDIARKRYLSYPTVLKICRDNEYGFWTKPARLAEGVKKQPITNKTKKLTGEERKNKISDDALEIIELALEEMKNKLKAKECSATQLKDFVNSVIPYIITKPDSSKKDSEKDDINETANKLRDQGWK